MALPTYTNPNITNDPVMMTAIDSAVASAPADRAATFTPAAGYTTIPASSDTGIYTAVALRPKCFEPPSYTASIDPGLAVSG